MFRKYMRFSIKKNGKIIVFPRVEALNDINLADVWVMSAIRPNTYRIAGSSRRARLLSYQASSQHFLGKLPHLLWTGRNLHSSRYAAIEKPLSATASQHLSLDHEIIRL